MKKAPTLVVTAIIALMFTSLPMSVAAQQTCFTWKSSPGDVLLTFQNESWLDFELTLGDGSVRICNTRQSGNSSYVKYATCEDAPVETRTPMFFVPFEPGEPLGDAALVLGTVPYYADCE